MKGREAADRALALSPELAAAHDARGDLLQRADFDWRGAEAEYRRAQELAPNDAQTNANSVAYQIAEVYALRNDPNATFEWLDRAWSTRDPGIVHLLYDPFIQRYKNDPRFAAFCRKVGLPVPGEAPTGRST
jgi:tetratricopeptide (TPR) repeat protein